MDNQIFFKQLVEIFVHTTLRELRGKYEGYKVNFIFDNEAINFFYYISQYPYTQEGYYIPNITDEDIQSISAIDYDYPTIVVHDYIDFFDTLVKIVNASLRLLNKYGDKRHAADHSQYILRRIWLRLGPDDVLDVESFLQNQLSMIENELFDDYKFETKIDDYYGYNAVAKTGLNLTYDESPRSMHFYLQNESAKYDLPKVHFGIVNDVCYIYGVQNKKQRTKDKKIERLLYKLNKDKEHLNIHPSAVYSVILFINLLIENGIFHIKVPILQLLSYDYHVYLSEKEKLCFPLKWNAERLERINYLRGIRREFEEDAYRRDLEWYHNLVDKENCISSLKIDYLYNLMIRVQEHFPNLEICNEVGIQGNYIDIKIKKNNLKKDLR